MELLSPLTISERMYFLLAQTKLGTEHTPDTFQTVTNMTHDEFDDDGDDHKEDNN